MSLLGLLRSRTEADFNSNRADAEKELLSIFSENEWELFFDYSEYTDSNKKNLWKNELRKPIKKALEKNAGGFSDYAAWLEEIHFISISAQKKSVFSKAAKNIGWRVSLFAVPAAGVIALGIASHYQGGQKHNQLGKASNLLYDAAYDGLKTEGASLPGRMVHPADWDKDGIITSPITILGSLDLSTVPNIDSIILKDVRTTTTKKILASFISIDAIPLNIANTELVSRIQEVKVASESLADNVYPFKSVDEFEPIRSLALQDLAAANVRLQLRKKSSTRSVVRVYYGPPGTGKTITSVREAVKLIDPAFDDKGNIEEAFGRFNEMGDQAAFVTFHPSLQYEDLIESIRPVVGAGTVDEDEEENTDTKSGELEYRIHEGLLLRMIRKASENPDKDYVVVIDEINRGDVSRILGPLISSLEPDKRVGAEFPIGVELQYPRAEKLESRLYVPPNIHIIGTMNSADRNIALVDHALRRRFDFVLCPPDTSLLGKTNDTDPIQLDTLLHTLNRRIEHLLDKDHCIGHGYFMRCKTNSDVVETFARKVLPLLSEYFYGNMGLMLLVLGDEINGSNNIYQVLEPETSYGQLFNVSSDAAAQLGYRTHEVTISCNIDPMFWDTSGLIPGPQDEQYAVSAIKKIYSTLSK